MWIYFQKTSLLSKQAKDARFLHIAPEAFFERQIRKAFSGQYLTADLFDPEADLKMDVCDIQFPDRSFDLIFCSHVLEHVHDDRKAMREFSRVLTDNGVALFLVPITAEHTFEDPTVTDPDERFRVFGQKDHVRRYGPDFEQRLRESGFTVERRSASDLASPEEIIKMGLAGAAGDIFECHRCPVATPSSAIAGA